MADPIPSANDPAYIEKKREELRLFFKDANFPKDVIENLIENELKPLTDGEIKNRPYIAASWPGEVKSEYEVMTGQPFTEVQDFGRPLTVEEIKEMLKDSPIIAEKARQIQITTNNDGKNVEVPFDQINLNYSNMQMELDSATTEEERNKIKYKNMQSLMNSVAAAQVLNKANDTQLEEVKDSSSSNDEEEFEAIDKVVTEYTHKSYETRFQETKDMLTNLADKYDDPNFTNETRSKELVIQENPILKESSSQLIKGQRRHTFHEEIKENYSINKALNISLKDNPVKLDLSGKIKKNEEQVNTHDKKNDNDLEDVLSSSFRDKLKSTEKTLQDISDILNFSQTDADKAKRAQQNEEFNKDSDSSVDTTLKTIKPLEENVNINNYINNKTGNEETKTDSSMRQLQQVNQVKFDAKMEDTLHTALEEIFEIGRNDNKDNKELEFKEMKNLARNIVEGAENLSTLIREDITNKLNSMNELLNDVNEALENSRKSNIVYQKLKADGENMKRERLLENEKRKLNKITEVSEESDQTKELSLGVSQIDIDGIHNAIGELNQEIKCHEDRINKSKANYEMRNEECKEFMKEVDVILKKSQGILHPTNASTSAQVTEIQEVEKCDENNSEETPNENLKASQYTGENQRKELWDIDIIYKDEKNKRLAELRQQELERNKRINDLLYDIKDKMKDNKDVVRIANNLLQREETRKTNVIENTKKQDLPYLDSKNDLKAQGDHALITEKSKLEIPSKPKIVEISNVDPNLTESTSVNPSIDEKKKKEESDKEKQKEFKMKLDKEKEELNRGPRMTKEFIKNHCKQHKLYCTPYLNDILYLHFKGFSKIENLEEYTGLKCLFLENNGIQRIEGLDNQSELRCLYLHYNIVRKIENLQGCPRLDTLNLDHNFVTKIENLDVVPDLHTLSMAHNMLATVDDLEQLKFCKNLSVLDLSNNRLDDPLIVDVLAEMAILKVLVLTGNPVVRNIPAYRKTLTLRLKELLNLDNRPVFPRDRACAEAWQRGGVQEEIAERQRWIRREQDRMLDSVRHLMKIKNENLALREAREKEAKEKQEREQSAQDGQAGTSENKIKIEEIEDPLPIKETFESEVKTKDGILVDMLSGSEAEDSTSEDSDSESDDEDKEKKEKDSLPTETNNIEWDGKGVKQLIQEIENEATPPAIQEDIRECWQGYRGNQQPKMEKVFTPDVLAINSLLFNEPSHTNKQILKSKDKAKEKAQEIGVESQEKYITEVKKKPLIEIIDDEKPFVEEENADTKTKKILIEEIESPHITEEDNIIIDHDRKIITEKQTNNDVDKMGSLCKQISKASTEKPKKQVAFKDINNEERVQEPVDNEVNKDSKGKDSHKKDDNDKNSSTTDKNSSYQAKDKGDVKSNERDGVALINYLRGSEDSDDDEDYKPSAEDLEIFAELEQEQLERQARIDRGEPAVDPMKLYDKKTMEEYHKAELQLPAHLVKEEDKIKYTTYKHDNAFDRIALSQLTAGDTPDETKVKLTHVPGATLFQYINDQTPGQNVEYEIGEENVDSGPSSEETVSINISDDNGSSSSEEYKPIEKAKENVKKRPATASSRNKQLDNCTKEKVEVDENPKPDHNDTPPVAYDTMMNVEREEAKRSIIDTMNSSEDDRFPSQGVNYSDMSENARIDQAVASEILDRTLQHEEREFYRQYDMINLQAGKVDNQTNEIIERVSAELADEFTLHEVSGVLDTHVKVMERRRYASQYANYELSPTESDEEDEHTLVLGVDDSFEDTLTEKATEEINDSGIVNDCTGNDNDKSTEMNNDKIINIKEEDDGNDRSLDKSEDIGNVENNERFAIDNSGGDEIFEDCVDDINTSLNEEKQKDNRDGKGDCVDENYSIEMKLTLGIEDKNV
ncbi:uncharacterized protein dtr [Epargyreus clarus]|uniref:uncharacterized protein dtr n=1 Tax=Epargyreus clarus TaxID=520877 RepID=UPI003C2CD56C